MPEVEYIKNVMVASRFEASEGYIGKLITAMPSANPDDVIIRAINFNGKAEDTFLYLVWCNLTNDFIASFCGGNLSPQSSGTTIRLNSPVPNMLEFRLFRITAKGSDPSYMSAANAELAVTGDLAIHLDFVKYKRVPPHA